MWCVKVVVVQKFTFVFDGLVNIALDDGGNLLCLRVVILVLSNLLNCFDKRTHTKERLITIIVKRLADFLKEKDPICLIELFN